jgi:hypothetical protein
VESAVLRDREGAASDTGWRGCQGPGRGARSSGVQFNQLNERKLANPVSRCIRWEGYFLAIQNGYISALGAWE